MNGKRTIRFLSLKHQQDVIKSGLEEAFATVFEKSHYILGSEVQRFEQHYATYSQTKFCIGVGSGLDALIIALKSLRLSSTDEVIVPANTYHATWLAVVNVGARIVPVEPDEGTFNLDAAKVADAITSRTKVILPVHLYGQPCDMTALTKLSNEGNLSIVEDNAQAQGAHWKNKKTGSWGVINATSFYPTKNLGALGDGGAITTDDPIAAEFVRAHRNYGSLHKDYVDGAGMNSRLDEMQAAFLNVKLKFLDEFNTQRRLLASKYNERLTNIPGIVIPAVSADAFHVYHLYVIRAERRDALKKYLLENGIESMIHYPVPPHVQKAYANLGYKHGSFPITERIADSALSLPLWPGMTDDELDYIATVIRRFYL
ncbi:MAG TPA: DegT/DnrJ/EryC1/StrS family aminotransferase [Chryseosolibacter sp.]